MNIELIPRHTHGASVQETTDGWRLQIPAGPPRGYRLAQLDDYISLPRRFFGWDPPTTLSLRARLSSSNLPGTWGFGLWNDPFGLAIGFGGTARRLPALPNAAWFFHASKENFLSLQGGSSRLNSSAVSKPDEAITTQTRQAPLAGGLDTHTAPGSLPGRELLDYPPPNGFFAGTFLSPGWPLPILTPALLALPFLALRPASRLLRRLAGRVIRQDGRLVEVDVTRWHAYSLGWQPETVTFFVDGVEILHSPLAPRPPLGLVIWIDNQYAAWRPDGRLGFGTLTNPNSWMEVEQVKVCDESTFPRAG